MIYLKQTKMHKHNSFSQILSFYSKCIYLAGGETPTESLPPREVKELDQKLNKITLGFDKINEPIIQSGAKNMIKKDLKELVANEIKSKLHNDPAQAQQLFDTLYANKLDGFVQKASQKLNSVKFQLDQSSVNNIKFGSRNNFVKGFKTECGVKEANDQEEISMDSSSMDKNLASKVAKQAQPEKIRTAVGKAKEIAVNSVKESTKTELAPQIKKVIKSITEDVTKA